MKGLSAVFVLILGISACQAFSFGYDIEACATLPDVLPGPRIINATAPVLIDSPGFNISDLAGSVYPANTTCEWVVYLDNPDEPELTLSWPEFEMVSSIDCSNDYVEIYDGIDDTGVLLGRHCGNIVPEFSVTSKTLFIRFQSDGNLENTGFLARLGYPITNTACQPGGQTFDKPSGLFYSLNYPQNYNNDLLCVYRFDIPEGQRVRVEFGNFDLAQNCNDDVLEVYEGDPQFSGGLIGRYYGDEMLPAVMISRTNQIYMQFSSDNLQNAPGFWGSYQFIPA